jgi:hypothetical protein
MASAIFSITSFDLWLMTCHLIPYHLINFSHKFMLIVKKVLPKGNFSSKILSLYIETFCFENCFQPIINSTRFCAVSFLHECFCFCPGSAGKQRLS